MTGGRYHTGDVAAAAVARPGGLWSVLLALFIACWAGFFYLHPAALNSVGVGHYRIEVAPDRYHELWFLDTFAILASNDALAAGADPYAANRLDYMQRPHVYGPAWLLLGHLGLTRAQVGVVGSVLDAAFILAAVLFLRPRGAPALLWSIAVFCTTPVLAALERANNDLVVFLILTPVVPCLLSRHVVTRAGAVLLIGLATALKYYPAVAGLLLLAAAPLRELRWRLVAAAVMAAVIAGHVFVTVPRYATLPAPRGVLTFGAVSVFHELGFGGLGPQLVVLGCALLIVVGWWRSSLWCDWQPQPSQQREWLYFILGSVLLTGCFFVGQHFAYRWVFAIWLAPLLWSLARDPQIPSGVRGLARVTAGLLLVMLWGEAVLVFALRGTPQEELTRALRLIALGMQPLTWAFYGCLLGFLTHFTRQGLLALRGRREPQLSAV